MTPGEAAGPLRVSICIDNYNYAEYLGEAIDSALGQTYPHVEVIVVDDGSEDDSRSVVSRYGDQVMAVFQDNAGQGAAFRSGFTRSSGDIVFFLDADDRLRADAAEVVVRAFASKPDLVKVQYRMAVIDAEGDDTGVLWPPMGAILPSGDLRAAVVRFRSYPWQPTTGAAFAASFLRRVLPEDDVLYHQGVDTALNLIAPLVGPIVSLPDVHADYRMHNRNDSASLALGVEYFHRRIALVRDIHTRALQLEVGRLPRLPQDVNAAADVSFMTYRLASLKLDRVHHPLPSDRTSTLVRRGIGAALTNPFLPGRQRVIRSLWFLAVGVVPRPIARRLIEFYSPDTPRQSHREFHAPKRRRSRGRSGG
jgi:glycosyltransferase involved in cell wall biosynthesis